MNIIDMHCDTLSVLLEKKRNKASYQLRKQDTQIDLEKMKASGYLLQNFAVFVDMSDADDPLKEALRTIDLFYDQMEQNADLIAPVRSFDDIKKNMDNGKMSALLTLEEGGICHGEPEFLSILYRLGARMMTLTWNYENELGFPNMNMSKVTCAKDIHTYSLSSEKGLKERGIFFLEEMERLGIIIDVSHLSDAGFYDVLSHTKKPFVASHSNARGICSAVRNLTDDMIRKLADRGGITGINFCQDFLGTPEFGRDYVHQAVRQMKYLIRKGGEDFVALGSDFDGITPYDDMKDCRIMPRLADCMKKEGFSQTQIEKIFYKNVLRIYRELLKNAD